MAYIGLPTKFCDNKQLHLITQYILLVVSCLFYVANPVFNDFSVVHFEFSTHPKVGQTPTATTNTCINVCVYLEHIDSQ